MKVDGGMGGGMEKWGGWWMVDGEMGSWDGENGESGGMGNGKWWGKVWGGMV